MADYTIVLLDYLKLTEQKLSAGIRHLRFIPVGICLIMLVSSCISLKRGYIRNTRSIERRIIDGEISPDSSLSHVDQARKALMEDAGQLEADFPAGYRNTLKAWQLNRIFTNLHDQLAYDSVLHAIVRVNDQPEAVAGLLQSASGYDRFFRQNSQVRRTVNRGNKAYQVPPRMLNKTQRFLLTPSVRKKAGSLLPDTALRRASLAAVMGFLLFRKGDRLNEAGYDMVNWASSLFGNFIGTFNQTYDRVKEQGYLMALIEPLDIILMKSETHLSDKFIPGYFGHLGIYTGDQKFLEGSGWLNMPEIRQYEELIGKGYCFIEGLRSNVALSSPEQFTDGEIFLILRVTGISDVEKKEIARRLFRSVSLKYDFNFDIQSPDRLFCSELVYLAFDQIDWLSHHKWNRESISPDEIALTALKDTQIKLIALVSAKGVISPLTPDQIIELMKK